MLHDPFTGNKTAHLPARGDTALRGRARVIRGWACTEPLAHSSFSLEIIDATGFFGMSRGRIKQKEKEPLTLPSPQ